LLSYFLCLGLDTEKSSITIGICDHGEGARDVAQFLVSVDPSLARMGRANPMYKAIKIISNYKI
jgi:hypothetical protein